MARHPVEWGFREIWWGVFAVIWNLRWALSSPSDELVAKCWKVQGPDLMTHASCLQSPVAWPLQAMGWQSVFAVKAVKLPSNDKMLACCWQVRGLTFKAPSEASHAPPKMGI